MSQPNTPATLEAMSASLSRLVAQAPPGVVAVYSRRARSSGFIWKPGLVVTADEALAEEGAIAVTLPGGETVAATVAGRDPTTDIALLRLARDGAPVAAIGVVSFVGGAWHSMRGGDIGARIELDLELRREAEGGPVLDTAGRVLGMAVFGPRRRVLVIPAATVEQVAARLKAHGRMPAATLG